MLPKAPKRILAVPFVPSDTLFLALLAAFFAAFLLYPMLYVLRGAFGLTGDWAWGDLLAGLTSPAYRRRLPLLFLIGLLAVAPFLTAALLARRNAPRRAIARTPFLIALATVALAFPFLMAALLENGFTFELFQLLWRNTNYRQAMVNTSFIGAAVVAISSVLALALALPVSRYRFAGKGLISALILVPMIMPPFVGAIGVHQFLTRYGSLNLLLMRLGLIDPRHPVDWLGEYPIWGVIFLEALHLYPILYLNLLAALTSLDATLEEAAQNLGARGWRLFRDVTFPLILPGYFAGAIIVFIWAFTDLGTPLIFGYREVIPVKIFDLVYESETNPVGYALVLVVLLITAAVFAVSRRATRGRYEMLGDRGGARSRERSAGLAATAGIYALIFAITAVALIPHLGVVLKSTAARWSISVLPEEYTLRYYGMVFNHPLALSSIRNSLVLSVLSTAADLALGFLIAYYLMRKRIRGRVLLDVLAMLPLALPGIILAFGYITGFAGVPILDPREGPFGGFPILPLLVIGYTVRRLPFTVRAAVAGFEQTSVTYEEASANLGAPPATTIRRISIPLIFPHLVAGGILAFAFAMLEVSESLMLAFQREHYPIAKAIYAMAGRTIDGPFIASAMGVLGMLLLVACFYGASKLLGRRLGEVFRL